MTTEQPSRNAPANTLSVAGKGAEALTTVSTVSTPAPATTSGAANIRVSVPKELRPSEADMIYPLADIVWRGEPLGDRHAQVAAIVEEGIRRGMAAAGAGQDLIVEAEVTRFHSITEKARRTIGGHHSVHFNLTVRDPLTGAKIIGPRSINASRWARGGAKAAAEDQAGRTMRVVIVESIAAQVVGVMQSSAGRFAALSTAQGNMTREMFAKFNK